jgi:hypothetical protein
MIISGMAMRKTNFVVCIQCRFTVIPPSFERLFVSPGLAALTILARRRAAQNSQGWVATAQHTGLLKGLVTQEFLFTGLDGDILQLPFADLEPTGV